MNAVCGPAARPLQRSLVESLPDGAVGAHREDEEHRTAGKVVLV
ncbi:hypothetical protein [Isoptericola luteus]|nr:hypothetical protein [Isoptericola sp. NEAU-Y5]